MDNRNLQLAQLWSEKLEDSINQESEPASNVTFWATLVTAYATLAIAEKFYEQDAPEIERSANS